MLAEKNGLIVKNFIAVLEPVTGMYQVSLRGLNSFIFVYLEFFYSYISSGSESYLCNESYLAVLLAGKIVLLDV